jgi:transcription initiation factor TFIID subunit 10
VPGASGGGSSKDGGLGIGKGAGLGVQRPGFGGGGANAMSHGKIVLTMEDLGMAVSEYGVNLKRAEFYR